MKSHKDLDVYKKSIEFVTSIYRITESFPKSEQFGLVSQMRRAAVSLPSNISEGAARQYRKEYIQFLYIAQGSLSEIETQLTIALSLEFIEEDVFSSICDDIIKIRQMLMGLIKYLKA
jgi:four helix bundle protein